MKALWNPTTRPLPVSAVWEARIELEVAESNHALPMAQRKQDDVALFYRAAFDAMRSGRGDEEQWGTVVFTLNMALLLCEAGYGPEWETLLSTALEGAFRAKLRADKTNKWGFDGPALSAIAEALEVHEAQLAAARQADILAARDEMKRRIDAGIVLRAEQ